MKLIQNLKLILGGLLLAGIAACGGGGGGTASDAGLGGGAGSGGVVASGMGTMKLSLTDAPACGYDEVNVTIEKVRVHQGATAGDDDGGWSELVLNPPRRINLLDYTNGALLDLGGLTLPPGQYSQLRLVLAANDASAPLENSVKPTGGAETELSTPSAQQSGLKLKVNIDVPADKVAHVVLDFDACKSVVKRGNSGKYNLKPVLSAITVLGDGQRVAGYVDAGIALPTTHVSVQFNGVPFKATAPDANGLFILYPVPVGTYDLVVTSALHATAVMTGVPVTATEDTVVSTAAVPIKPTGGDLGRVVKGEVAQATAKVVGATVRAMQTFTDGTRVEVAWQAVDALPGEYQFLLPTNAPEKTAYLSATPLSLGFTADTNAAGEYMLQAVSSGLVQTGTPDPIDVNTGDPANPVVVNFMFP